MSAVDLVDETFIRAPLQQVADAIHEADRWLDWWPDLVLSVFQDRDLKGIRWSITGALVGSMELWLEPCGQGVIVHHYLRADPTDPAAPTDPVAVTQRAATTVRHRRQTAAKGIFWALKDELESAAG